MIGAFLKQWRFFLMLGTIGFAFIMGWQVHGWKLGYEYNQAEFARQESFREAMEANAAWVAKVNNETQLHEQDLQRELALARQQSEELRYAIENRPVVREVVREAVVGEDGIAVCPPVPSVDWSVFQDLYNRAATGSSAAPVTGGGNGELPTEPADDHRQPRDFVGNGSF
jgi:hypothetical protein